MLGVVACSNPSGNAALEGVVSGCGGVETGELLVEMVARVPLEQVEADLWHLAELLYRVAPTHPKRGGPACTNQPALRHTAPYAVFMKHGSKSLVTTSKSA